MMGPAVDFDGDPFLGPEQVKLIRPQGYVGVRPGKPGRPQQLEASALRLGASEIRAPHVLEQAPQHRDAGPPRVTIREGDQFVDCGQTVPLRHGCRNFNLPTAQHASHVHQRPAR